MLAVPCIGCEQCISSVEFVLGFANFAQVNVAFVYLARKLVLHEALLLFGSMHKL